MANNNDIIFARPVERLDIPVLPKTIFDPPNIDEQPPGSAGSVVIDSAPTSGSANVPSSGGTFTALATKQALLQIQDEGINQGAAGAATTMNFVGAGVSVAVSGAVATVTIAGGGGGSTVQTVTSGGASIQYLILTGTPTVSYSRSGGTGTMAVSGGTIKLVRFADTVADADRDGSSDFKWNLIGSGTDLLLARPATTKYTLNATDSAADASTNGTTSNQVDADNTPAVKYGNIVLTGQGTITIRSNSIPTSGTGAGNGFDFRW
jgi:hypothetical protein